MLIPKRITELPPAIAFRYISGLMMRPDDGAAAEEFKSLALAEGWLSDHNNEEALTLPREVVQGLVDAAKRGAGTDLDKMEKDGGMAGNVLLYVLRGKASNIRDFGLDKAMFLVAEMWPRHRAFQGANNAGKGAGRDTVFKNWTKYRPVAHLWAAYTALVTEVDDPKDLRHADWHADWATQDRARFFAVAQGLLIAGSNCHLPRGGQQLLNLEQCWSLEDIDPELVNFIPLQDEELTLLQGFKSRFRS